jgi:hypothetical protein
VATKATTRAHLTAVGMTGSDAQINRLLTIMDTDDHNDVATFVSAEQAKFSRNPDFASLSQADELKLWTYRQIWAKVRIATKNDAALVTEGWKHSSAALTELS